MLKKMTYTSLCLLLFTFGCSAPTLKSSKFGGYRYKSSFHHKGIFFGRKLTKETKSGIQDGCSTAQGTYTKNHALFNKILYNKYEYKRSYKYGWYLGRYKCKGLR